MKKLCKRILIGISVTMLSAFWAVGCSAVDVYVPGFGKTLDAVPQSSISAALQGSWLTVEWGAVNHATSYLVTYDDTTLNVEAPMTRAVFTDVEYVSGSLTITIIAQGLGYYDSEATEYTFTPGGSSQPPQPQTLTTPIGFTVSNGVLSWNAVSNATTYTVSYGAQTATVNTNQIDLVANGFVPASGSATYSVVAKASGYNDSAAGQYTYTPGAQTLAAPTNLGVADGILSWSSVSNATSYVVSDGTKTVTVTTNSVNLTINALKFPTSGSVTYTVTAKASGYNDSAAAQYTYTASVNPPQPEKVLDTPTGFNFENSVLSWTAVKNATSYTVTDGTKTVTVNTNSINLATSFTLPNDGGIKPFSIVAKADGYDDSVSAVYNYTSAHRHTFNIDAWEKNKTHHWHDITCGHDIAIEYMSEYAVHEFEDGDVCSVCGFRRNTPLVNQFVNYGEYPQSLKADNVTLGASADANGYYTGSDGAKYAKVTAAPAERFTGDQIVFNNNERIITGTVYFFKVEPIKWRVLEHKDGSSLLFSSDIIGYCAYYGSLSTRTIGGETVYPNNYKHSDIRTWLNGTFYNVAFSSSDKQSIKVTTVDNSGESTGISNNPFVCENTQDKVFLLGSREARDTAWGFDSDNTNNDPARLLIVSDYARACGVYARNEIAWRGCGAWWSRSPLQDGGPVKNPGTSVESGVANGWIGGSTANSTSTGVAPAIRVATSAIW